MKRGLLTWLFGLSLAVAMGGLFAPSKASAVVTPINSQAYICASGDISAPAVEPAIVTPQTAAASILSHDGSDVCGNDPVNICDPLGLEDFVVNYSVDKNVLEIVSRDWSWLRMGWGNPSPVKTIAPTGNTYTDGGRVTYTRNAQGGWHQYQANNGVYSPAFAPAMEQAMKDDQAFFRVYLAATGTGAVGPLAGGAGLVAESFVGASAYSASYELAGLPMGDTFDPSRYTENVVFGTAGGVALGGAFRVASRLFNESATVTYQVGEMMPNGQLAGIGPGAAIANSPEFGSEATAIVLGQNMEQRVIPAAKALGADWLNVTEAEWSQPVNDAFIDANVGRVKAGTGRILDIGWQRGRYRGPQAKYMIETQRMRTAGLKRVFTGRYITAENGKRFRLYEWVRE